MNRLICGLAACVVSLELFSFKPIFPGPGNPADSSFRIKTVIVDAGHGNYHPTGTGGYFSKGADGTYSHERD
ncbi:MAG TPA: hypothetical protein VHS53_12505, partial [Mucilaginibacter sp.]|nr:hypothetical protein [Mucilaginibacter sp.]